MRRSSIPAAGIYFFWAGFICSISFLEAWLKFQAPGVTLPIGLSIGKLIFTTVNRVEWVFLLISSLLLFFTERKFPARFFILPASLFLILLIQSFGLLPKLNAQAEMIIAGMEQGTSPAHLLFGIVEVIKVGILLFSGYYIVKQSVRQVITD